MLLPESYLISLLVLIAGALLAGSWPVTYKLTAKWRFEYYYLDFALGAAAAAILFALTLGNLGYDGFSIYDDVMNSAKKAWLNAFVAGAFFNLGNMLTLGAASMAGIGVSYPIALGLGLVLGVMIPQLSRGPNPLAIAIDAGLVLLAVAILAAAYLTLASRRRREATSAGMKPSEVPSDGIKPVVLSVAGGVLMAVSAVFLSRTRGDFGLGPYSLGLFFCGAILLSTVVFSMFLMNLPLEGEPLDFTPFARTGTRRHALGILGGALWYGGSLAFSTVSAAPPETQLASGRALAVSIAPPLLAALWGIRWGEFAGAETYLKLLLAVPLVLFLVAMVFAAIS